MFAILKRNPLAAGIAIAMHLAIILLMVFGLDWLEKPQPQKFKVDVVQARVVDAAKVDAEVERLKQAEQQKKKKAETAKRKEQKRLDELRNKRKLEEKRVADLKKKRKQEEKAEAKRKAEAKKRQAEEKKRKEQQEKKRKQEAQEKKRKAAEAKKRKAAEAKKRKLAEQRKLEEQLRANMEAERDATEIELYQERIRQSVTASWLRPVGVGDGLKCTLRLRMAAGGHVIAAEVIQGSGNGAFDRSARAAVLKADPLPVPSGRLFERFRDINFEFAPSGVN